jgi:hypothetical protein
MGRNKMNTHIIRILSPGSAAKLADLYLPVYLRDFYLNCNPLVQCFLYERAASPEEFFTNVLQEEARITKLYRSKSWGTNFGIKIIEETIPSIGMTEAPRLTGPAA